MTQNVTSVDQTPGKPTHALRSASPLDRLYKLAVVTLAAFVVLGVLLSVARAAVYKIRPYERGLHLRGGRFIALDEPG